MNGVFASGDYGYAGKSRMMGDKVHTRAARVKSAFAGSSKRSSTASAAGIRIHKNNAALANIETNSQASKRSGIYR